jgi:hypothetical protein
MSARQRDIAVATARKAVGEGYDFATIGYQGLADFLGWHWALLLHLAKFGHEFDCSQLVAACGVAAGEPSWMCGQAVQALVTPAALRLLPGVTRVVWP